MIQANLNHTVGSLFEEEWEEEVEEEEEEEEAAIPLLVECQELIGDLQELWVWGEVHGKWVESLECKGEY